VLRARLSDQGFGLDGVVLLSDAPTAAIVVDITARRSKVDIGTRRWLTPLPFLAEPKNFFEKSP
jgi:hypothetical protein